MCRLRYKDISNLLFRKINYLVGQNRKSITSFTQRPIKNDHKINFFVGLVAIKLFNSLLEYTKDMVNYRGTERVTSTKIKRTLKFSVTQDELLLALMRLSLVLLNEYLADRLYIAPSIAKTCFKGAYNFLGKPLESQRFGYQRNL